MRVAAILLALPAVLAQASPDAFVDAQTSISLAGVLSNIGPDGSKAQGAKSGIVIASPSKTSPNYFYTWSRDSALVTKAILEEQLITGAGNLGTTLANYAAAQAIVQHISNPSGDFSSGGLWEPKFNVDNTAFTGAWGRPQRDGPALRAITLIGYGNYLLANGNVSYVQQSLVPLIQADLDYVVTYWNQTGFDLWEEVQGSSFFTIGAQYRSLVEGTTFFSKLGKPTSAYAPVAAQVLCFLQSFWNTDGYIVSNINGNNGRSGKDANSILASIHAYDSSATDCSSTTFQPCSDRALANHKTVTDSFRQIYKINAGLSSSQAVSVGRYPEDSYYGGNPWYLCTLAAGEQLYSALNTWSKAGSLSVTPVSLPFFTALVPSAAVGTFAASSPQYAALTAAVRSYADGYLAIVQARIGTNGALSEQFDRNNGTPLSAVDLTWSYAAFLTAANARGGHSPPGWASNSVPSSCGTGGSGNPAPPPAGGNPGTGGGSPPPPATGSISVVFNEIATTVYGENIFIVGSIAQLGNWNPASALPLSAAGYTSAKHLWSITIALPPSTTFQYKYIRKAANGAITWESNPNRSFNTPASGPPTENDTWR